MKSNKKYQVALSKLGDEFSVSEDILKDLETYVGNLVWLQQFEVYVYTEKSFLSREW